MTTVYKYSLNFADVQDTYLPKGAQILTAESQQDADPTFCIWALVDPQQPTEKRVILLAGTGHPIPYPSHNLRYINTFTKRNRSLWFHAFEVVKEIDK